MSVSAGQEEEEQEEEGGDKGDKKRDRGWARRLRSTRDSLVLALAG